MYLEAKHNPLYHDISWRQNPTRDFKKPQN